MLRPQHALPPAEPAGGEWAGGTQAKAARAGTAKAAGTAQAGAARAARASARSVTQLLTQAGIIAALAMGMLLLVAETALAQNEELRGRVVVTQTNEPIEDVTLEITDEDGEEVETVETDDDGRYSVELPGPGTYEITIDPDTLPEDFELLNPDTTTKTVTITPNGEGVAAFRLSDGSELSGGGSSRVFQLLFEGIRFGLIIAITAIGLSLVFGTTGLINFAQGDLVAYGAFAAWAVNTGMGAPLWLSTIVAVIVGAALGAANEFGLWRPLRRRGTSAVAMLIAAIGLAIALRNLLLIFVGGGTTFYDVPPQREVDFGLFSATPRNITAIVLCTVVLVGVAVMLQKTRIGTAMRAVADNRDLAAASGINVNGVIAVVWILGGALAAFGGVMYGWTLDLRYDMGFALLLLIFAGVILGGLGTAYGALVGSVLIGIVVQLSTLILPSDVKYASGLAVLIAVLLLRPQGLLGTKERIG